MSAVVIHGHDDIAARAADARERGSLLPAVAAKGNQAGGGVSRGQLHEPPLDRGRVAVIDDDDLVRRRQDRGEVDQKILDPEPGQVGRDDD